MLGIDIATTVDLDILRGDLTQRINPPPKETQPTRAVPLDRLSQLEVKLEEQLEEEEKWEELTSKLERKAKQMADSVVRLETSLTVFRLELNNRTRNVDRSQEALDEKREEQRKALEKLERDRVKQLELAEKAKQTVQEATEALEEAEDREELLLDRLRDARMSLMPLEERVQNLETNLNGNSGMSDSQRFYYSAECQVERESRDRILNEIQSIQKDLEKITKDVNILEGKIELFQDEEQRRILKAKALEQEIQETRELFWEKLTKYEAEVDAIRQDRDAWEEKTNKLAEDLEHTRVESAKLTVKARLFNDQLNGIRATVQKLKAMIEDSRETTSDTSESSEEDQEGDETHASTKEEPYVWRPIQKSEVLPRSVPPKPSTPVITVTSDSTPAVVKSSPSPSPVVVKVNHMKVHMKDPVQPSHSQKTNDPATFSTTDTTTTTELALQLQTLKMDLEHQKRFQREQAIKVDQQMARLGAKLDVLVNTAKPATDVANASTESQLNALKHQMQTDAMRDAHEIRELLLQLNKQCENLTKKVEDLTRDGEKRAHDQVRLERKLQKRESEYAEQLEELRGEMEKQIERQQQIFSEKMSNAMMQMEKFVEFGGAGGGGGLMKDDSMASLESLAPLDSSSRRSSRNSLHDDYGVPTPPYSMVKTGIAVSNSPLLQTRK